MQSRSHVEQVGGTHYQAPYQHWDLMDDHQVSYLESCASKYVMRWREKGGIQDLQKSISYLKKRLAAMEAKDTIRENKNVEEFLSCGPSYIYRNFNIPPLKLDRFLDQANVPSEESWIIKLILQWENKNDLLSAIDGLAKLINANLNTSAP